MRYEIRTFEVVCDRCKKTEIVHSKWSWCDLPEGWNIEDVHGCGMTNYTRTDDLCPECLKKNKDRQ